MNLLGFFEIALLYRTQLCWGSGQTPREGSPARVQRTAIHCYRRHIALEPLPILSFAFMAARLSGQVSRAINLLELTGYS
jgi:hypothetical protein